MCAVSFAGDFYGQYPTPFPQPIPWPTLPAGLPWTPDTFAELKEIMRRLDNLDKKLGLEACEDPKKLEWMQGIEERLRALEKPRRRQKAARP